MSKIDPVMLRGVDLRGQGASGTGVAHDDTAAIRAALVAASVEKRALTGGSGRWYYVQDMITLTDIDIDLTANLIFGPTGGLRLQYHTRLPEVFNLNIDVRVTALGSGASIDIDVDGDLMNVNRHIDVFRGRIRSTPVAKDSPSHLTLLRLNNVQRGNFELGGAGTRDLTLPATTKAYRYRIGSRMVEVLSTDNSQPVETRLTFNDAQAYDRVVHSVGSQEGLYVAGTVANCGLGVYADWSAGGTTINPLLVVGWDHTSCAEGIIDTRGVYHIDLTQGAHQAFKFVDAVNYVAVKAVDAEQVRICPLSMRGFAADKVAGTAHLLYLDNVKRSVIDPQDVHDFDGIGTITGVGSVDNRVLPTANIREVGTGVVYAGGAVPVAQRGRWYTETNSAARTVAPGTTNLEAFTLALDRGETVDYLAEVYLVKGASDGVTSLTLTATFAGTNAVFPQGNSAGCSMPNHTAGDTWQAVMSGYFIAPEAGNYQIILAASSIGSNATVGIGKAALSARRA